MAARSLGGDLHVPFNCTRGSKFADVVMRSIVNGTACAALPENVTWDDPTLISLLSVLALIDVMVIVGNCLVIAAVYYTSKLRSVTNFFIVSLAVADLLVGVAVLPFSSTWEIYKVNMKRGAI